MEYGALVRELDLLVAETCGLWNPGWVTFNWRNYTYDHVQRVRGLAMTLCRREGGDVRVTELAALLHDITKPYDGEYVMDAEGKRAVDANGFWRNAHRLPERTNEVTALYDALDLAGELHNVSGAEVAAGLLRRRGVDEAMVERVAQTVRHHLKPPEDAPVESRCLSDADTIDANIGLPAFVRNIYIHLHLRDERISPDDTATDRLIRENPLEYLRPYVAENLPRWSEGKRRDFVPRLLTRSAVALAEDRLAVMGDTWARLRAELDDFEATSYRGAIAAVLHYMRHRDDPSIASETAYLADEWLPRDGATPWAHTFLERLQREIAGKC